MSKVNLKLGVKSALTFGAVSHAALRWLQVVDQEVPAVADGDGDPEQAAVPGAAVEELPGGAGGELADLARRRQRGVLQGQPQRRLRAAAVHLRDGNAWARRVWAPAGLDSTGMCVLPPRRWWASPQACC